MGDATKCFVEQGEVLPLDRSLLMDASPNILSLVRILRSQNSVPSNAALEDCAMTIPAGPDKFFSA
jgi:sensor domain CHASE-containing protein